MIEEWYLLITLFVLQADGNIDERKLYSVPQKGETECSLEANARVDLFKQYVGKDHIRRFVSPYRICGWGMCAEPKYDDNDPFSGTYKIGLNGTLVNFSVGCEMRRRPNEEEWDSLPDNVKPKPKEEDKNGRPRVTF